MKLTMTKIPDPRATEAFQGEIESVTAPQEGGKVHRICV